MKRLCALFGMFVLLSPVLFSQNSDTSTQAGSAYQRKGPSYRDGTKSDSEKSKSDEEKSESPEKKENHVFKFEDIRLERFVASSTGFSEYLMGQNSQAFSVRRYLKTFSINRYETTYRLWYEVRVWAQKNGYYFENPGQEGSGGMRGRAPTSKSYQPVTMVNWYDVIVWCNALSEMEGRTPCYVFDGMVLRDSGDTAACDLAECRWEANGYRLPTEAEWEYAARKTTSGFQRGDLLSGQIDSKGKSDQGVSPDSISWSSDNANGTHTVGTAGLDPILAGDSPEPASGNANGANLFDMSGNVLEWCWDWHGEYKESEKNTLYTGPKYGAERVMRGGSWSPYTIFLCAGDRYSFDPNEAYNYFGFRFCTSR